MSERTPQDVLRELRTAVQQWVLDAAELRPEPWAAGLEQAHAYLLGKIAAFNDVSRLLDKAIAEAPDSPEGGITVYIKDVPAESFDDRPGHFPTNEELEAALFSEAPEIRSEQHELDVERLTRAVDREFGDAIEREWGFAGGGRKQWARDATASILEKYNRFGSDSEDR